MPHTIPTSSRSRPISYQRLESFPRGFSTTFCCLCFWTPALHFHPFSICCSRAAMELTQGCRSRGFPAPCVLCWLKCCSSPEVQGSPWACSQGTSLELGSLLKPHGLGAAFQAGIYFHPRSACLSHALAQQESRASLFWLKHQDCDGNIK